MADVFVSYAREDEPLAKTLSLELTKRGCSVWWDRSLISGSDFRKVIATEIAIAKKVLVIWTRHSIDSHWVLDEAAEALRLNKLVPIKVGECDIPLGFRSIHTLALARNQDSIDDVESALRGRPLPSRRIQPASRLFRWTTISIAVLITLATAGLGATYLFPSLTFRWVPFDSPELGVWMARPERLFGRPRFATDGSMVTFESTDPRNQLNIIKRPLERPASAKDDFENEWKALRDLGCNTDHIWEGKTSEMCEFSAKHLDLCILSFSRWISARNSHVVSGMRSKRLFYKYTHFADDHKLIFEVIYTCDTRKDVEAMINGIFSRGSKHLIIEGRGVR